MSLTVTPSQRDASPGAAPAPLDRHHSSAVSALARRTFRILTSYGLSCALFFLLFVITLLGTLEQVEHGLYATQEKYFESAWVLHHFGRVPVPLPGAPPLMALLFLNILCGAVLQARKGWNRLGILTAHAGILLLLAGAFLGHRYGTDGRMTLREGEQSSTFENAREWELAITELRPDGTARERLIPAHRLDDARNGKSVVFDSEDLPFEVEVAGYALNVVPRPASDAPPGVRAVDGFYLQSASKGAPDGETAPGAYVTLRGMGGESARTGIVWGGQTAPWRVNAAGREWALDLRRVRHPLPFAIELEKFHRESHPRTELPKAFASDVVRIDGGVRQPVLITMNAPLRCKGYTIYQASWAPADSAHPGRPSSTFAVAKNPAERFPLYACSIVAFGLTLHFAIRLMRHLKKEGAPA